jgi:hypothetical protein
MSAGGNFLAVLHVCPEGLGNHGTNMLSGFRLTSRKCETGPNTGRIFGKIRQEVLPNFIPPIAMDFDL